MSTQLDTVIAPFGDALARLDTIPGVNQRPAEVLIAELGVDMRVFPTAGHLASWAGLCPGNNESASKHMSGRTRKGKRWLRSPPIEAALGAGTHSAKGAFAARYRRVLQHRGHKKAVVAVAHAMLITAYHLLTHQTTYHDPDADYTNGATPSARAAAPSKRWNARATARFSNPPPEREVNPPKDFLSKTCSRTCRSIPTASIERLQSHAASAFARFRASAK